MKYKVRTDVDVSLTLCENDTVKSVLQNLYLLYTTRKGSIPMYREFGLDMSFIDKPTNVARTLMAAEVRKATERFEPRAKYTDIKFEDDTENPGKIIPIVEVDI